MTTGLAGVPDAIAKLFVAVGINSQELDKGLKGLKGKLETAGKGLSTTGMALSKTVTASIVGATLAMGKLTSEAVAFEGKMNEVFTLMPGISKDAMDKMSGDVKNFAEEFGVLPDEIVPALYQAISASVPPDNVFSFLEIAQKAAVGGVTELETAVDGITSVINAYGTDVISASQASDLMFTAVKLGKTTFGELSQSLFQVIPSASALGVEFGDVTAALATLTSQGTPTRVATTQMRQLLVELSKEGGKASKTFTELAGKSFKQFVAEGGNVQEALQLMEKEAHSADLGVNDLFSSVEAGNAALGLTGKGTEAFANALEEMGEAAGATEQAYETMEEGVGRQLAKLKASFAVLRLEIGKTFLPILNDVFVPILKDHVLPVLKTFAEKIKILAEWFQGLSPKWQKIIIAGTAFAAILGPLLVMLGMVVTSIAALIPVFALLVSPIGLVIAAIALLVAGGVLLYKNWDKIREKVGPIFRGIKDTIKREIADAITSIENQINRGINFINGLIEKINKIPLVNIPTIKNVELPKPTVSTPTPTFGATPADSWMKNSMIPHSGYDITGYDRGGVVSGPLGSPQLIMAHAGETILPTHKSGGKIEIGGKIELNISGEGAKNLNEKSIADAVSIRIAEVISSGDRRIPNRASLIPIG